MIPFPGNARVWIALEQTDMRRGMDALARQVLQHDPHCGDLYLFRGRQGDLIKILWADDVGLSLYIKRLERGRFIWPSPKDGVVAISASQLACFPATRLQPSLCAAYHAPGMMPCSVYLILNRSEKEWKMSPRKWTMAKAQFAVMLPPFGRCLRPGERFIKAMAA